MDKSNEPVAQQQPAPLLPGGAPPVVARTARGTFAPGQQGYSPVAGATGATLQRASRALKNELAKELAEGGAAGNPLCILLRFARDESYHPAFRASCCDKLAKFLVPSLLKVGELEDNSADMTFNSETGRVRATLRALLMNVEVVDTK